MVSGVGLEARKSVVPMKVFRKIEIHTFVCV